MADNYDRRTAAEGGASPEDQAKSLAKELLGELSGTSLAEMNEAVGARVTGTAGRVGQHLKILAKALAECEQRPNENVGRAINDAHFVLEGQLESLRSDVLDWADKLGGVIDTIKARRADFKALARLAVEAQEWAQPKVEVKGQKNLGTPFKWQVAEVSRKGEKYLSYIAKTHGGTFRIAPADLHNPKSGEWVLDRHGGMAWEKYVNQTFKTPNEAASALVKAIG